MVSGLKGRNGGIALESVARWYQSRRPRMDIKFPVLGLLMEENMTGYDLKRRFNDWVGFYYRTSDGSLYPALGKLKRDRLVTMKIHRTGARSRKVYAITAAGRERFLRLLAEPPAPTFVHDEAKIKLVFGRYQPRLVLALLQNLQRQDAAYAAELAGVREEFFRLEKDPFRRAVFEYGRRIQAFHAQLTKEIAVEIERALSKRVALQGRSRKTGLNGRNGAAHLPRKNREARANGREIRH